MTSGSDTLDRRFTGNGWPIPNESVDLDIRCAAGSRAPVLITGPAGAAESIAREIHRRESAVSRPFTIVDCEHSDRLAAVLQPRSDEGGTLLLRGVHRLSPALQRELKEALRHPKRRIVASTPVRLERAAAFDETLFYRLNIIHIDLGHEN
jgi:DNA-binding NtrC family response regulator